MKPTEYMIDNPDFAPSSCLKVKWHDNHIQSITIGNEFDSVEILATEWHDVAEAVYKLMEDHK